MNPTFNGERPILEAEDADHSVIDECDTQWVAKAVARSETSTVAEPYSLIDPSPTKPSKCARDY